MQLIIALCLAAACGLAHAQASGQRQLLLGGRFDELERLYAKQAAAPTRDETGELPSVMFYHSMDLGIETSNWDVEDAATRSWMKARPGSAPAAIARALLLSRRAEDLERQRNWGTVDGLVDEALRLLESVKSKSEKDVSWHASKVSLARRAGWTNERLRPVIAAGIKADPDSIYFLIPAARALAPDPHQSTEPITWLAKEVTARAPEAQRREKYANLYIWLAHLHINAWLGADPLGKGGIDWKTMDAGLADMYKRNPNDALLNHRAAFACLARDRRATAEHMKSYAGRVVPASWRMWGGDALYERCKAWALPASSTS